MSFCKVYYNDIDPHCCDWLLNLMDAGLIPQGDIDRRDVREVRSEEVRHYRQRHWCAGIGGWALALRLADWGDRPVDSVSAPCPIVSVAGRKKRCPQCGGTRPVPCPRRTGFFICIACEHAWHADDRHIWPEFRRLFRELRPPVIFGEQVSSADGEAWLSGVQFSLEGEGFALGACDLPAGGVGAPHVRQRFFWVADAEADRWRQWSPLPRRGLEGSRAEGGRGGSAVNGRPDSVAHAIGEGLEVGGEQSARQECSPAQRGGPPGGVGQPGGERWKWGEGVPTGGLADGADARREQSPHGPVGVREMADTDSGGFWDDCDFLVCADGKVRRTQRGLFPLVAGVPFRLADGRSRAGVSRSEILKGIGNAIVPQLAAEFIRSYRDARRELEDDR